jgi:hypothetical protein
MPVNLIFAAQSWEPKAVKCTFTVWANEVILAAKDRSKQIYELPAGTKDVRILASPTPTPSPYWESRMALSVASNGAVLPTAGLAQWVGVRQASGATAGATLVTVKVSRFRDVTGTVRDLLKVVPGTPGQAGRGGPPTQPQLKAAYGKWPPDKLDVDPLAKAHFLDLDNPVKAGGILNFKASSVAVDADSVVFELAAVAGVKAPRLFGVVWPDAVPRTNGAEPTPFLVYIRQTGWQDGKHGVFGAKGEPYPYHFDYAERCLFESQHYSATGPISMRSNYMLRPKGVPYQVARSGAKVVTVYPVAYADVDDKISYGVLSNFDEMGRILAELQAVMFWTKGITAPPTTVGKVALSGYSSVTYWLAPWLDSNRASTFLKNNISAVYFLDPPNVDECVNAGRRWRENMGKDKRVRFYSARLVVTGKDGRETSCLPAYRRLLDLDATVPLAPPFLLSAHDNNITMALFPLDSWIRTFKEFGIDNPAPDYLDKEGHLKKTAWEYWDAHHLVPATVLRHALAQGDLG